MTWVFDPSRYAPIPAQWFRGDEPNELGAGSPHREMWHTLENADAAAWFEPHGPSDEEMAEACRAGLLLRWDGLHQSHTISQSIHNATGSYWHGIMHRREGDFSNAKYWFRRVGHHPVFDRLAEEAVALAKQAPDSCLATDLRRWNEWDSFEFVDWCQRCVRDPSAGADLCRRIALVEWQLLFDYCYDQAKG